jgi:hypothetical protein
MRGGPQRRHRQIATTLKEPRQGHLRYLASTQTGQAALVGRGPPGFVAYRSQLQLAAFRCQHTVTLHSLVRMEDRPHEAAYLAAMQAAGYTLRLREPEWFRHRLLKGPDSDINLHVFSAGCPERDRMLRFRDRLRNNADDRELYVAVKRELAGRDWTSVQRYADAKTTVIEEILARAQAIGSSDQENA